jgi:hypothetical protein
MRVWFVVLLYICNQECFDVLYHQNSFIGLFNIVNLKKLKRTCIAAFVAAQSCQHSVEIVSEPSGSSVFDYQLGKRGALLGLTPLVLSNRFQNGMVALEVSKDGFEPKFIFAGENSGARLKLNATLKKVDSEFFLNKFAKDLGGVLNAKFSKLIDLQNEINQKNHTKVLELEKKMTPEFETVSLFFSMIGNYYYLAGDKKNSRDRHLKALELDPQNAEAREVLRMLGVSK